MDKSHKNKHKKQTGAYETNPAVVPEKRDPHTNTAIPSKENVERCRNFVEENKK